MNTKTLQEFCLDGVCATLRLIEGEYHVSQRGVIDYRTWDLDRAQAVFNTLVYRIQLQGGAA